MAHAPIGKRKKSLDHDIHKFQGRESILTSQINLYVEEAKPKIPDGGWGWVVLFAAFMLNTISEGVSFSFGLLLIEFLKEFGASKSATSWIGSLFLAIPLLAGPIGSAMVDRYGCMRMTMLGGLVCATGFVLSAFADSIALLYFTFGVVGGIGRGLTFVTAVVSIAFWFEQRRTLAVGLAASGAGVGTVVFAPLTTWCIEAYGWRGTMLMLAGAFLNMCVCGAVMWDPDWIVRESRKKKKALKSNRNNDNQPSKEVSAKLNEIKLAFGNGEDVQVLLQRVDTKPDLSEKNRFRSVVDLPTYLKKNEKVPVEVLKQLSENKQVYKLVMENYPDLLSKSTSDQNLHVIENSHARVPMRLSLKVKQADDVIAEEDEDIEMTQQNTTRLLDENHVDHSTSHSYLSHLKLHRDSIDTKNSVWKPQGLNASMSSPEVYKSTVRAIPQDVGEKKWYMEFYRTVKSLVDFSLFMELHFLLLAISTIILFIWFIVPYFYLAEHMIRIGYSENQAAYALSVIGFTNTVGMIILGWVGVRMSISKTYAVCLLLCGVSIAVMMFLTQSYVMLMVNSGLFGLFFSSCFALVPSLLAELVPLDDFTMSYGLILLCEGIGNLVGPPLAGFLFDLTGSWEQSFYQAAVWIVVCGVFIAVIPFTRNRRIIGKGPTLLEKDDGAAINA